MSSLETLVATYTDEELEMIYKSCYDAITFFGNLGNQDLVKNFSKIKDAVAGEHMKRMDKNIF